MYRSLLLVTCLSFGCGARDELPVPTGDGGAGGGPSDGGAGATGAGGDVPVTCGDGVVQAPEECDEGAANQNIPNLALLNASLGEELVPVVQIVSSGSPIGLYDYRSESAHTGFEGVFSSVLFVHQQAQTPTLDLFTVNGIDFDETGLDSGDCGMTARYTGLPPGWFVSIADDFEAEFAAVGPDSVFGDWEWHHNSDGGVISGLPFPGNWRIQIDVSLQPCVTTWEFAHDDGETFDLATPVAVLQAFDRPSLCRPDCTIPVCGDGYADGGEVCDDGNNDFGDGCAGDCSFVD